MTTEAPPAHPRPAVRRTVAGETPEEIESWCEMVGLGLKGLAAAYRQRADLQHQVERQWTVLSRIVDALQDGVQLCDRSGRVLHRNRVLESILEDDPEGERLREEVTILTRSLLLVARSSDSGDEPGSHASLLRNVRTSRSGYQLRGVHLGGEMVGAEPAVVVVLQRVVPRPASDVELQEAFGLTPQQVRIARFLSEGRSNKEIARVLHISRHTVRHHVEHVLLKLDAHSRAEVGSVLLHWSPEPATGAAAG